MSRVCVCSSTSVKREGRVDEPRKFLMRYDREGKASLTGLLLQKIHGCGCMIRTRRNRRTSSPSPVKARVNKSGRKYMFIMFADN